MTTNPVWYAGRCVKQHEHDKVVNLEVIARLDEGGWVPVENAQRLFGRAAEVELRCSHAKAIRIGEWEMFQLSGKGRNKLWIAGEHKRLYRYIDLAYLGGVEQVQRYLAGEELRTSEPSGAWVLRSQETEVLQVDLRQVHGVAQIAALAGKVPVFPFVPDSVIRIPVEGGEVTLYDLRNDGEPAVTYDWSSDEAYVLRIARAIADTSDPRAKETIAWLEEHAKKGQSLQSLNGTDLAAANDALRSGKLAKRLAADHALLRGFVSAMLGDTRVAALVKAGADAIAEEERRATRARVEANVLRELEQVRRQRLAALDAEIGALASDRRKEAEDRQTERALALERELAVRKEEGQAEINRSLGSRTATLETQADELAGRCDVLRDELHALRAESEGLDARLLSLRAEEQEALANLDRLLALSNVAKPQASATSDRALVPLPVPTPGTPLPFSEAKALVASCKLLSETGKSLMLRFLVLLLAGEVPVLCGPDVVDFLLVAESLFTNGTSARLEGDPTVITFEDLWLRPGSNVHTALGQALAITGGMDEADPRTMLAVVERAERSGARFWFPALAARARRGELPRRLLTCVTIEDEESEEAAAILARAARLNVRAALAPQAAVAAIVLLGSESRRELDPGQRPESLAEGLPAIAQHARRLDVATAQRAARTAVEAMRLGVAPESLVELFVAASTTDTAATTQPRSRIHA